MAVNKTNIFIITKMKAWGLNFNQILFQYVNTCLQKPKCLILPKPGFLYQIHNWNSAGTI
jgi:hypothetical protein